MFTITKDVTLILEQLTSLGLFQNKEILFYFEIEMSTFLERQLIKLKYSVTVANGHSFFI